MKTKLLVLFLLITFFSYSQTPIENHDSASASIYAIVTGTLDQTNSGSTSWNFTVTSTGETTQDSHASVTTGSTIEMNYPGTTSALTTSSTVDPPGEAKVFTKNDTNEISITGVESAGLTLNYSDNGLVGTFPLTTGNGGDNVSGTFSFSGNTGNFSGTITTLVDAFGVLTINDFGSGGFSGEVTRLKIDQNLDLNVGGFPVGNVVQSSFYYYDANNANLVFRYSKIEITGVVNQSSELIESLLSSNLSISNNRIAKDDLSIFPNPAKNTLNFKLNNKVIINSIVVSDISGRQVIKNQSNPSILSVAKLNAGLYIVTVITNNGKLSRKFIKK